MRQGYCLLKYQVSNFLGVALAGVRKNFIMDSFQSTYNYSVTDS